VPSRKGAQTVKYIVFDFPFIEKERENLKPVVKRTENWASNSKHLGVEYHKNSMNM